MSLFADKIWDNVNSYPEVEKGQKDQQLIYYTTHFSPYSNFGSIKELLPHLNEKMLEACIEELYMMPTMEAGLDDEEINDEFRFYLHGNMYHEINRIDRLYTSTWNATPKKKKKKRAFF